MNNTPKVGIVIVSYSRLEYTKQALRSALGQSYQNLKILLIDDHSPDPEIKTYLKSLNSPRVRWVINPQNLGVTKNYAKGVRLLGPDVEWCLILDNDDYLAPDCIKEAVNTHLTYPLAKVIHCRQIFITQENKFPDRDYPLLESAEDYLYERAYNRREIRSSSVFFSRRQYKKVGGYPQFASGLCTDPVFIFALAFDNTLAYAKSARVYTRLHQEAESHTLNDLFTKFRTVRQMTPYCKHIYQISPAVKSGDRERILRALKFYEKRLVMVLLSGKLRELLFTKSLGDAQRAYTTILRRCRAHGIVISKRSLFISYLYAYTSLVLESLGVSTNFMFRLQRLGSRFVPRLLKS